MTRADAGPEVDPAPRPPARDGRTEVDAEPRRRAFLHQSFRERAACFWWALVWQTLFRWSPPACHAWRLRLLKTFGATIQGRAWIAPSARVDFPWNLTLGDRVVIAHKVILNCMGHVTVGDRTRISQYAHLVAGTHDHTRRDMTILRAPIDVGKDVWIAADAFVGPGVRIGDGALLAARASAFKDLPPGQVCVGEPARPLKSRPVREDVA